MPTDDPQTLSDSDLTEAIARQKEVIARFEEQFLPLRARYERLRVHLRQLDAEVRRRDLVAQGVTPPPSRPRRSTLVTDILAGREPMDADLLQRPLADFRFLSLRRQDVLLNGHGDPTAQVIAFVDAEQHPHTAATFASARQLFSRGLLLGSPGIPLQRQAIYYVAEQKAAWLRADQIFVEIPAD